jgi:hypothetical protein
MESDMASKRFEKTTGIGQTRCRSISRVMSQHCSPVSAPSARTLDSKRCRDLGVDDICGQLQYLADIVAETAKRGSYDSVGQHGAALLS